MASKEEDNNGVDGLVYDSSANTDLALAENFKNSVNPPALPQGSPTPALQEVVNHFHVDDGIVLPTFDPFLQRDGVIQSTPTTSTNFQENGPVKRRLSFPAVSAPAAKKSKKESSNSEDSSDEETAKAKAMTPLVKAPVAIAKKQLSSSVKDSLKDGKSESSSEDSDSSENSSSDDSSSDSSEDETLTAQQAEGTSVQASPVKAAPAKKALSSSEESDSDEEASVAKKPVANGGADGKEGKEGRGETNPVKVIASGKVVNDKIRVVPISEKVAKKERKRKRSTSMEAVSKKEKICDPNFTSSGFKKQFLKDASATSGSNEMELTPRTLRERKNQPILNEDYIFELQHELLTLTQKIRRDSNAGRPSSSSGNGSADTKRRKVSTELKGKKNRGRKLGSGKNSRQQEASSTSGSEVEEDEDEIGGCAPQSYLRKSGKTADWDEFLREFNNIQHVAPVQFFANAPFSKDWKNFARVGMKVEVPNPFVAECNREVYWVATVVAFAGYKALLEFETFDSKEPYIAWMSFCSNIPKPLGYCDKNQIVLFPPQEIYNKYPDYLEKLRTVLNGEVNLRTVSESHGEMVSAEIISLRRFEINQPVEAMDNRKPWRNNLANITGVIGDRVHISYMRRPKTDPGFWFNNRSDRVHELGWSYKVGHDFENVPKKSFSLFEVSNLPPFPKAMKLSSKMVFEVIHPVHLDRIVGARIKKVYRYGYFLAEITCKPPLMTLNFCFHVTSPWILPCGFAQRNGLDLCIPYGAKTEGFSWSSYCEQKKLRPLDLTMLVSRPPHKFVVGCKLEAIDLRTPTYCGPATVFKVAEHLLFLHFDGWPMKNPTALHWVDAQSPDIYPIGWAEMMGHDFQSHPEPVRPEDIPVQIDCLEEEAVAVPATEENRIPNTTNDLPDLLPEIFDEDFAQLLGDIEFGASPTDFLASGFELTEMDIDVFEQPNTNIDCRTSMPTLCSSSAATN